MNSDTVAPEILDKFIKQTYHWKTLSPETVRSMAVELSRLRFLMDKQYQFIGDMIDSERQNQIRSD